MKQLDQMMPGSPDREGALTKALEKQTAKIPSVTFLNLALGSIALSLTLELFVSKRRDPGLFVGQWAPTFLLLGIYNKLVKLEGSDRTEKQSDQSQDFRSSDLGEQRNALAH